MKINSGETVRREIRSCLAREGMLQRDLAAILGISASAFSVKINSPDRFTVPEVRRIIKTLKPSKDVFADWLGM